MKATLDELKEMFSKRKNSFVRLCLYPFDFGSSDYNFQSMQQDLVFYANANCSEIYGITIEGYKQKPVFIVIDAECLVDMKTYKTIKNVNDVLSLNGNWGYIIGTSHGATYNLTKAKEILFGLLKENRVNKPIPFSLNQF